MVNHGSSWLTVVHYITSSTCCANSTLHAFISEKIFEKNVCLIFNIFSLGVHSVTCYKLRYSLHAIQLGWVELGWAELTNYTWNTFFFLHIDKTQRTYLFWWWHEISKTISWCFVYVKKTFLKEAFRVSTINWKDNVYRKALSLEKEVKMCYP